MIDSHCHLDFPDFNADRDAVLERSRSAGVTGIINPGCDLASSERATALALRYDTIWAAVGVHPHSATEVTAEAIGELTKLASLPKVVAIGEIGLDYYKSQVDPTIQKDAFLQQLVLAERIGRPVIVHSREADRDTIAILEKFPQLRGVLHCFGGGADLVRFALEHDFYLGFTGICTFPAAANIREIIESVPLSRILLETDAPYLAPVPHRGQRCEPAFLPAIAQQIAQIKGVTVSEVQKITTQNTQHLFKL